LAGGAGGGALIVLAVLGIQSQIGTRRA
jgi:hypothetical protein